MQTDTGSSPTALTLLSEEEVMFRDAVAGFAEEEVRPRVAEMEKAGRIDPALLPRYFELGLMGIAIPEQWGGSGAGAVAYVVALEEIARACASHAVVMSVNNSLYGDPLARFGTDAQREQFL